MMITHEGPTTSITGGIYELDGNTGFTAAIAEMLLQSYSGEIHVLPAIPPEIGKGEFKGLVAYGGHKINVKWDNKLVEVTINANADENIILRYEEVRHNFWVNKNTIYNFTFDRFKGKLIKYK